jgi:hypothetical protein
MNTEEIIKQLRIARGHIYPEPNKAEHELDEIIDNIKSSQPANGNKSEGIISVSPNDLKLIIQKVHNMCGDFFMAMGLANLGEMEEANKYAGLGKTLCEDVVGGINKIIHP